MKLEDSKISEKNLNELIFLIQNKLNKKAYQILYSYLNQWMNNVSWRNMRKFPCVPINIQDIKFYKKISFFKSVMKFNGEKKVPFAQFTIQQLNWFLLSKLRNYSNTKFKSLNFSLAYNDELAVKNKSFKYATLSLKEDPDWTYYLSVLSKFEKIIFKYRYEKYKNREIANILNISAKKVDNAWQRIKKKLKACIIH